MTEAFYKTLHSLTRPKILMLLFVPLIASLVCWMVVFWFFWGTWVLSLSQLMQDTWLVTTLQGWFSANASGVLSFLSVLFLLLLFLPLAYLTATLLTSIFVMPIMVNLVVKDNYADLEMKKGGSFAGSFWNSLFVGFVYLVGMVLTLPLWLIPGGAIAAPLLLGAWMNKKIFSYDSLQDFASKSEFEKVAKAKAGSLYGMGILLGFLAYLPVVSFVLPVVMGLAYAHFCLSALRTHRNANVEDKATAR